MSINGIGFGNSSYDYLNAMNQVKMQQALFNNKSDHALSKLKEYQHNNKNNTNSSLSGSTSFINKYSSSMADLMSAANKLRDANSSSVLNATSANSSNENVLSASKTFSFGTISNEYEVNVKQLATAQTNVSEGVSASAMASEDLELTIRTSNGDLTYNASKIGTDGRAKTNKQVYEDIAKSINSKSRSEVKASVVEKDGKVSLQLTSKSTGSNNAFIAESTTISGVENTTQVAQDAIYTVKENGGAEKEYTSSSNKIQLDNGKVSATLKGEGTAQIKPGVDNDKIIGAVGDLVNSYNKALTVLNDNANRGTGTARQLANMLVGPASEKSMALVGITVNKDGTLKLDKDKLKTALQDDPSLTKNILGGSTSIAQGAFNNARSALNVSSASLINNDVKAASQKDNSFGSVQFANMFARRGAFNMTNYSAIGMMMDFWV